MCFKAMLGREQEPCSEENKSGGVPLEVENCQTTVTNRVDKHLQLTRNQWPLSAILWGETPRPDSSDSLFTCNSIRWCVGEVIEVCINKSTTAISNNTPFPGYKPCRVQLMDSPDTERVCEKL